MSLFKLREDARFSNKYILAFMLPMLLENLMLSGLSVADTFMVSHLGETSMAGIALVSRIDNFVKQFLIALGHGGSVVMSQYIGAENKRLAEVSLKNNLRIVTVIGMCIMLFMVLFRPWVLNTLYGGAEKEVLDISNSCFMITAFSYPFVAIYYSCSAIFRAMGNSRITLVASVTMMVMNLIIKYTLIFVVKMGVAGAALSTFISMAIVGIILLFMLKRRSNKVRLDGIFKRSHEKGNIRRILNVSVPNGIEQGMFQLGALLIAGLVSGLGTAAIAADSLARSITPFVHAIGSAFASVMMILVGRCMGAGAPEDAKFYTKHILKMDYALTLVNAGLLLIFVKPLISLFDLSAQAQNYAFWILMVYTCGSIFLYPSSFALAAALRGTGDTRFVMMVAGGSMFAFRIGAAYIFVKVFNMGIVGTWVAMVSDWAIRSVIFYVRFKRGKWSRNKVI